MGLVVSVIILSACSRQSEPAVSQVSRANTTSDGSAGQMLFSETCKACHGPAGEGVENLGPNLITSQMIADATDEDLLTFIKAGRLADDPANTTGVPMPPKGGNQNLTDAQLLDIIDYLRAIHKL